MGRLLSGASFACHWPSATITALFLATLVSAGFGTRVHMSARRLRRAREFHAMDDLHDVFSPLEALRYLLEINMPIAAWQVTGLGTQFGTKRLRVGTPALLSKRQAHIPVQMDAIESTGANDSGIEIPPSFILSEGDKDGGIRSLLFQRAVQMLTRVRSNFNNGLDSQWLEHASTIPMDFHGISELPDGVWGPFLVKWLGLAPFKVYATTPLGRVEHEISTAFFADAICKNAAKFASEWLVDAPRLKNESSLVWRDRAIFVTNNRTAKGSITRSNFIQSDQSSTIRFGNYDLLHVLATRQAVRITLASTSGAEHEVLAKYCSQNAEAFSGNLDNYAAQAFLAGLLDVPVSFKTADIPESLTRQVLEWREIVLDGWLEWLETVPEELLQIRKDVLEEAASKGEIQALERALNQSDSGVEASKDAVNTSEAQALEKALDENDSGVEASKDAVNTSEIQALEKALKKNDSGVEASKSAVNTSAVQALEKALKKSDSGVEVSKDSVNTSEVQALEKALKSDSGVEASKSAVNTSEIQALEKALRKSDSGVEASKDAVNTSEIQALEKVLNKNDSGVEASKSAVNTSEVQAPERALKKNDSGVEASKDEIAENEDDEKTSSSKIEVSKKNSSKTEENESRSEIEASKQKTSRIDDLEAKITSISSRLEALERSLKNSSEIEASKDKTSDRKGLKKESSSKAEASKNNSSKTEDEGKKLETLERSLKNSSDIETSKEKTSESEDLKKKSSSKAEASKDNSSKTEDEVKTRPEALKRSLKNSSEIEASKDKTSESEDLKKKSSSKAEASKDNSSKTEDAGKESIEALERLLQRSLEELEAQKNSSEIAPKNSSELEAMKKQSALAALEKALFNNSLDEE